MWDVIFTRKGFKRGGGHSPYIIPPPPSHTLPPCSAIDRTSRAFRNLYASKDRKAWQHSLVIFRKNQCKRNCIDTSRKFAKSMWEWLYCFALMRIA